MRRYDSGVGFPSTASNYRYHSIKLLGESLKISILSLFTLKSIIYSRFIIFYQQKDRPRMGFAVKLRNKLVNSKLLKSLSIYRWRGLMILLISSDFDLCFETYLYLDKFIGRCWFSVCFSINSRAVMVAVIVGMLVGFHNTFLPQLCWHIWSN